MADLSVTIANQVNSFGPAPSTKWGDNAIYDMTWGSSKWGEGTEDTPTEVGKVIENSQASDSSVSKEPTKVIDNSQESTFEMSSETLQDGSGYYYVFIRPSSDAENRASTTYTETSDPSTTWTSATVTGVSWTEV